MVPVSEMMIDLGDINLYMVSAGKEGAPCLFFLHGWPQSSRAFAPLMEELQATFKVVAVDLPGVGKSVRVGPAARISAHLRVMLKQRSRPPAWSA